jgi:signal transduction histidine kinase/ligand-binding sensor domain-containing protein
MNSFRVLLFSFFISFNVAVSVQSDAQINDRMHFERFRVEHGLPSNWVRDITQDKDGYLWLATEAGVTRYDGYSFKTFSHVRDDSTSLSNDNVSDVLTDLNGVLWVATSNALNQFDSGTNRFFRYAHNPNDSTTIPSGIIGSLHQTRNGTLWVGMNNGELASMDIATGRFTRHHLDRSRYMRNAPGTFVVTGLAEDSAGRLYVGIAGGGIHVLDSHTGKSLDHWVNDPSDPESIPNNIISSLFVDRDDVLWVGYRARLTAELGSPPIGSESGLFRRFLKTGETRIYTYRGARQPAWWVLLSDMRQTRDGVVWITNSAGNSNSLARYLPESDSFQITTYEAGNPNSLPWSYATSLYEDKDGILWVGTSRGLAKSDRSRLQLDAFTAVPNDPFDLLNLHYGILEVRDNVFWLNNDGLNAYEWDRTTGTTRSLPYEGSILMPDTRGTNTGRQAGVFDGKRTVWFNSVDNVYSSIDVLTLETTPLFPISPNFQTSTLLALEWMPDSTIWISSTEGVKEYDPVSKTVKQVDVNATLHLIEIGPTGTVWAMDINGLLDSTSTLSGNLLGRMDLNANQFIPVTITPQYREVLAQGIIHWFIEARDGTLWFGRNDGLVRYVPSTETFTLFDKSKGLSYFNVYTIIEDVAGFLWMSTEHSISRFDPKTERFRHFEKEDGLRPFRMNRGSAFLRKNGEILFGGVGGVNIFHPASIRDLSTVPRILITDVNVAGSPRQNNGDVAIDWDDNEISIEYVSVNFRNTSRTTYSYKLEGYHTNWVDAGDRRIIQFTNLPPGKYTLMVNATNAEGLVSEVPASLSIRILPPWWRTWWAYGFYSLMFAGIVYGVDRTQRRRLIRKEREEVREKELAQAKEIEKAYQNLELAHENLKSAQEQLVQQEKLASLGQLTAGIAHEIKNPLNFVNNFSEVSLEMVDEAIEEVRQIGNNKHAEETINILTDIKANLDKIHQHGTRADGIVKSMLMHSRGNSNTKEPTDLNGLIREYVNLSYHGMRAGKHPIDVDIELKVDESVGEIPLIAQDFSRVILNLCNNAFDAMGENREQNGGGASIPKLTVRTSRDAEKITIEIEDNGPGIPDDIKDKILQPFFTTKKGTQGTGLGLSITHDIIKAHGGSMDIHSKPGQTVFTIILIG